MLSACAAPTSYMGISFVPGAASPELQALAQCAQAGDKQAQLDLGIAYEEGRGVAVDLKRAEGLYRMAAADSGGITWVYVPATRRNSAGQVVPVSLGQLQTGLSAALDRLSKLELSRK
jgi:TPR repeat protein